MFLNKIARSGAGLIASKSASNSLAIVVCSPRRSFSIDEIGKRYGGKPYDYVNKEYGLFGQMFDSTLDRLGENSLIITVEGNFGAGKSKFAQELAKRIDFVYAREPDLDHHLYNLPNGHSVRDIINGYVGENKRFRIDSLDEWHSKPSFKTGIALQHGFYLIRWMQTRNALLHLFSTGQGVVLERSAFSDSVVASALHKSGLLSDEAWKFYIKDLVPTTLKQLWKPHVLIYLEKSTEECLKSIKSNGKEFEKNSKVYSASLLNNVENSYKREFLPEMKNHMHVLSYNSNDAKVEQVVEDMELLNFEDESKFTDWRIRKELSINTYRRSLSNLKHCRDLLRSPDGYVNVPEYLLYGEEYKKLREKLADDERYANASKPAGMFSKFSDHKEKIWF